MSILSPKSLSNHRLGDDVQRSIIKVRDLSLPSQRSVAIINTGGTISMTANASGALEPCPGYLAQRLNEMQEMQRAETPATTLFELLPLIDSSDMNSDDWIRIASLIESLYHDFDAFVVIMGTDTMAYAASALSFILEDLGKMIVLTGSMLPLSDLFNDAQRNLVVAVVMAATLDVPEVCVFMDDQLLRGNRTVKTNSGGLDAFESPNYPSIAKLETGIRFRRNAALALPKGRFRVHKDLVTNIAVWRMIPGFDDEYIYNSIKHSTSLRAIVLELYGTGNLSSRKQSLLEALATAMEKGIVIVATSQCLRGSVDLKAYALGRNLEAIGVVSGLDMTTEAVVTKLAYLLSWPDANPALIALYMGKNLRGEVTESQQKSPMFAQSSSSRENSNGDVFITTASISKAVQRSRSGKLLEFPTTPIASGRASEIKLKSTVPVSHNYITSPPSPPSFLPSLSYLPPPLPPSFTSSFTNSLSTLPNEVVTTASVAVTPVTAVTATAAIIEQHIVLPEQVLLESVKPTFNVGSINDAVTLIKDETNITNTQETNVKETKEKETNVTNNLTLSQIEIIPIQENQSIPSISVPSDLVIMKSPAVSEVIIDTKPVVITKSLLSDIESTKVVTSSEPRLINLDMEDAAEVILYTIRAHQEHQNSPSR